MFSSVCFITYSPHPRGCFYPVGSQEDPGGIFPASAGVFPRSGWCWRSMCYIPRIRGGVSQKWQEEADAEAYSPHPRGCFFGHTVPSKYRKIFPASAGVFPVYDGERLYCPDIPRIRGGVSEKDDCHYSRRIYSPHPRGCFQSKLYYPSPFQIFPASAGVFPNRLGVVPRYHHIPRIRGGVSRTSELYSLSGAYSPHPRGCFVAAISGDWATTIFPASAGVFLHWSPSLCMTPHIPRIRGGVSSA